MPQALGFDVYGTLVDPVDMGAHLESLIGDKGQAFGQLWHDKKVEYAFRRGLMQQYQDFGICTLQALQYCMQVFQIELSESSQQQLMAQFNNLQAFPDVMPDVISVDDVKTFKPSPLVYQYLMKRTNANVDNCWLVSSNPWDVIGGKAAGLKTAWIQRDAAKIFDPWGIVPDLVVKDLIELSEQFRQ